MLGDECLPSFYFDIPNLSFFADSLSIVRLIPALYERRGRVRLRYELAGAFAKVLDSNGYRQCGIETDVGRFIEEACSKFLNNVYKGMLTGASVWVGSGLGGFIVTLGPHSMN